MKKKSIVMMATLLILALGANLALATAANDPNTPRDAQSVSVAAPAQDVQPAPAMAAPPENYPGDPVGPHYHGAQYYPGWGCGYYHQGYGNSYCSWGCW